MLFVVFFCLVKIIGKVNTFKHISDTYHQIHINICFKVNTFKHIFMCI